MCPSETNITENTTMITFDRFTANRTRNIWFHKIQDYKKLQEKKTKEETKYEIQKNTHTHKQNNCILL